MVDILYVSLHKQYDDGSDFVVPSLLIVMGKVDS